MLPLRVEAGGGLDAGLWKWVRAKIFPQAEFLLLPLMLELKREPEIDWKTAPVAMLPWDGGENSRRQEATLPAAKRRPACPMEPRRMSDRRRGRGLPRDIFVLWCDRDDLHFADHHFGDHYFVDHYFADHHFGDLHFADRHRDDLFCGALLGDAAGSDRCCHRSCYCRR